MVQYGTGRYTKKFRGLSCDPISTIRVFIMPESHLKTFKIAQLTTMSFRQLSLPLQNMRSYNLTPNRPREIQYLFEKKNSFILSRYIIVVHFSIFKSLFTSIFPTITIHFSSRELRRIEMSPCARQILRTNKNRDKKKTLPLYALLLSRCTMSSCLGKCNIFHE